MTVATKGDRVRLTIEGEVTYATGAGFIDIGAHTVKLDEPSVVSFKVTPKVRLGGTVGDDDDLGAGEAAYAELPVGTIVKDRDEYPLSKTYVKTTKGWIDTDGEPRVGAMYSPRTVVYLPE